MLFRSEVIKLCIENNIIALIEIKAEDVALPVAELIRKSVESGKTSYDKLIVISFCPDILKNIKTIDSNIKIGITFEGEKLGIVKDAIQELKTYSINSCINDVTEEMVLVARENGVKTFNWTVNSEVQLEKAVTLKVDAIMSDDPKMMIELAKNSN